MALAVLAVCERVRLVTGAVSIVLCTLGGARSTAGKWDRVRHVMGSSGLVVGVVSVCMSGGFEMSTLGSGAGVLSSWGRRIGRRIEHGRA